MKQSILTKLKTGRVGRAQKIVIYAPEGFGKSTLASQFPSPVFLDVEDSTSQLDVTRLTRADLPTLASVETALSELISAKAGQTLVIDTIDWLEQLAHDDVIASANNPKITGIEDFGYGKGYTALAERMTIFLRRLDDAISAGINVVLLGHSKVVKFEPPDGVGPFDRYEMKLSKHVAPLVKEWADAVLFGNWRLQVRQKDNNEVGAKIKGVGGRERLMHCNRCAAWDAKNRHGLGDTEAWGAATIEKAFASAGAAWSGKFEVPANGAQGDPATTGGLGAALHETEPEPQSDPPDDIPGIPPVDQLRGDVARIIVGKESEVNAHLLSGGKIRAGQTWRDAADDYLNRIVKNPAGFLKVVEKEGGAK